MQENILLYLESIRTPFTASLFELITMTAETAFAIMLITIVFWNIDKKKGTILILSVFIAGMAGLFLKVIVQYPRPFFVIEGLHSLRVETATGYSFPSGHTLTAAVLWTSLTMLFRKKWLYIVSPVIIVLAGLSRLMLGVHWPTDVIGGAVLGVITPLILIPVLEKKDSLRQFELWGGSISIAIGLAGLAAVLSSGNHIAFDDITKLSLFGGTAMLGLAAEEARVDFCVEENTLSKVIRCVAGNLVLILISVGIKKIFGSSIAIGALRYTLCGLWMTYLYPLIGVHCGLFMMPPASTEPSES